MCVNIKVEPVEYEEDIEKEATNIGENCPEFIDIKSENVTPEISFKAEPVDDDAPAADSGIWMQNEAESRDANQFVEVEINMENESECDPMPADPMEMYGQPTSTSSANLQELDKYSTTSSGRFCCSICNKTFANAGNVQRHMLIHEKQKYKCDRCDSLFTSKIKLDKHLFNKHTVPNERSFPCDDCEKRFKSSSNLMQHRKVHLAEKPYQCPLCSKSFSFKSNLQKHQGKSRCRRPPGEPIQCHVCQKIFKKEFLLKSHLRRHDTERPFSCEQCDMKFKYKSTLIRHLQIHNGERPFPCPNCDKSFTHLGLLKPHLRIHTGEKPYECEICQKSFAHKHNMQRHKLRHDKVKHLVCDVCHKQFPKESRLKYHLKTHLNEKHFACFVCPKRFSHRQNVLRHYSRKHPGVEYNCTDTDASVALKIWDTYKSRYFCEAEEILG